MASEHEHPLRGVCSVRSLSHTSNIPNNTNNTEQCSFCSFFSVCSCRRAQRLPESGGQFLHQDRSPVSSEGASPRPAHWHPREVRPCPAPTVPGQGPSWAPPRSSPVGRIGLDSSLTQCRAPTCLRPIFRLPRRGQITRSAADLEMGEEKRAAATNRATAGVRRKCRFAPAVGDRLRPTSGQPREIRDGTGAR